MKIPHQYNERYGRADNNAQTSNQPRTVQGKLKTFVSLEAVQ